MNRILAVVGHLVMLALLGVVATYWGIKVLTPPPASAPPPLAAPPPREPDPVLAARMFGLVQAAQSVVLANVQVAGVFVAGSDSSAVLTVDGKPARAYLLGQEVAPGTKLEEVRAEGVTLSGAGGRQDLRIPPRAAASFGGAPPPPAYRMTGNTLSAPTDGPPSAAARPIVSQPPPPPTAPPPPQIAPQPPTVMQPTRGPLPGTGPEVMPPPSGNPTATR
jgi:general secretion pathway protein C